MMTYLGVFSAASLLLLLLLLLPLLTYASVAQGEFRSV